MPKNIPLSKIKHFAGFTLVELIVVITILVILGTVAFTSLGGYSASARDSQRIENLANLKKGLDIFRIKSETYPLPENSISILSSGSTIGYQGFAKDQVASIAQISKGGTLDPSDATIYTTYSTNTNRTKMQAMVFLEDASTLTTYTPSIIPEVLAAGTTDYTKRTPRVIGDTLGILLGNSGSSLNQPVQELYNATSFTGVDIVNTSTGYIGIFTNKISDKISGTGMILSQIKDTMITGGSKYLGCDTYDIIVGTQVWAACNVGASTVFRGTQTGTGDSPVATPSTAGKLFRWGESVAWTYNGGLSTVNNCVWNRDTQSCGATAGLSAWIFPDVSDAISDGADRWTGSGRWSTDTIPRGPCASGYHVPTKPEWDKLSNTLGMSRDVTVFALKLPMTNHRFLLSGAVYGDGTSGDYWSSSPTSTNSYSFEPLVSSLNILPYQRTGGLSVRCLRN